MSEQQNERKTHELDEYYMDVVLLKCVEEFGAGAVPVY